MSLVEIRQEYHIIKRARAMKEIKEISGVVRCQRSEDSNCVCCKGNHVYCTYIGKIDSDESVDVDTDPNCN